jgi:hypothetical protein
MAGDGHHTIADEMSDVRVKGLHASRHEIRKVRFAKQFWS